MRKGRPPKICDDAVFEAASRAIAARGPAELTLADIAAEAGLTAGALVQRFGSKRALLLKLMERFSGSAPAMFAALRSEAKSPLAAIRAYARCMAGMAKNADELARAIAWLHQDIADPEFRAHLKVNARGVRSEISKLLREAIIAREISPDINVPSLAASIEAMATGALFSWAVHQEGAAANFMARRVEALLSPHLTGARRGRSSPR